MIRQFLAYLNYIRLVRGGINRNVGLCLLGSIIVVIIFVSYYWSVVSTFTVLAETERVSGYTSIDKEGLSKNLIWRFDNISLCAGEKTPNRPGTKKNIQNNCDTPIELKDISGHLHIKSPFSFIIERKSNGPLYIAVKEREAGFKVYFQQDNIFPQHLINLPSPVFIEIKSPKDLAGTGNPITLPLLSKQIVFGYETGLENVSAQPMVRGGTVSVSGKTIFGNRIYLAKEITLKYGDVITVPEPLSSFAILLRADERTALQGIFKVEADYILVRGFFSEAQVISQSFLNRLMNDPMLSVLFTLGSLIFATIIGSLGANEKSRFEKNTTGKGGDLVSDEIINSQTILNNSQPADESYRHQETNKDSLSLNKNLEIETKSEK